jgi:antitoxin YefM
MTYQTTYSKARASLASLCNRVEADRDVILIQRRGREDVALIAASELSSLMETAHLLRSPANAERLLTALARAQARTTEPQSMDELRREVGLGEAA